MPALNRTQFAEVRGVTRMLVDASTGVVDVVERMHRTVQERPGALGQPVLAATQGLTGHIYRTIRGSMELIGRGLDLSMGSLEGVLPEGSSTPAREIFVSVLNGLYGDHLARTGNPLAIGMCLRRDATAKPTGKLLVLVHGLCMSDQQWTHDGFGHGAALAEELGYLPLYLRYNSGLSIADNGRLFADQLEQLTRGWPRPIEELVILGHSMGGLVARAACVAAAERGHDWPRTLTRLVFLGTPHGGAPLERGGHGLDVLMDLSPYSAPFTRFGKARSAGIRDLRRGTITAGEHRFVPLPDGVACYSMAATLASRRSPVVDRLVGDGLVPLRSALGQGRDRTETLRFARDRQWVGYGMGHLELLHRAEVYAQLRAWLQEDGPRD